MWIEIDAHRIINTERIDEIMPITEEGIDHNNKSKKIYFYGIRVVLNGLVSFFWYESKKVRDKYFTGIKNKLTKR